MSSHHLSSTRSALGAQPTNVTVSLGLCIDADLACIAARSQSAQHPARKLGVTVPMAERRAQDFKNLADENFVSRHDYLEQERTEAETHGPPYTVHRLGGWHSSATCRAHLLWRGHIDFS